ncbi:MAG: extracellular solute-binding protein [Alphaproteobacteria bacterium]|nr:extracellular solute-binding protein [Alphaproteobacteria bacterium]
MNRPNRRSVLRSGVGLSALASGVLGAPTIVTAQGKPHAGTTINAACFQTTYFEYLKNYFPEFEDKTGIKVNFNMQAFPVYNQRTDLELSTRGSALDVINVTFIYSGRWIGAGWVSNLDPFLKDPKLTPAGWDPEDFAGGPQSAMKNAKGETFGFTWEAGAMILGAARYDLIERAGLGLPKTFDDLIKVCDAVHNKDNVAAFTADRLHHWNWIPYLMGVGGAVFKDPPENLTPTLATPQAAQSAEWYANLLTKYGPDGVLSYSDDQAMRSQISGRANIRTQAITWMVPLAKHADSTVQKTVRYGLMPEGPKGNFPGSNSHGLGIPAGSKKKEAAWEFIKWALSKETIAMVVKNHGYPSVCRLSIIKSPEFKQVLTLNGQDVASMYLDVLQLGGKTGYMKYRTVPIYPQVGDKINKAIERIATKQQNAPDALKQAQAEAIQDLQKAGIKIDT